ncbi:MAG TPA: hypothetical protein VNA25_13535 [Phycisphaerae bacterium]|nr:hypothetical protein [Phycisphaerae bacterium]
MLMMTLKTYLFEGNGAQDLADAVQVEADGKSSRSVTIPAETDDVEIELVLVKAAMRLLYMKADKAVTVKVNDALAPPETFELLAGEALIWREGGHAANPFTDDVTALFVSNAATADAVLEIRVLHDSTPEGA